MLRGEREPCKRRTVADPKPEVTRHPPNSIVDSSFNVARTYADARITEFRGIKIIRERNEGRAHNQGAQRNVSEGITDARRSRRKRKAERKGDRFPSQARDVSRCERDRSRIRNRRRVPITEIIPFPGILRALRSYRSLVFSGYERKRRKLVSTERARVCRAEIVSSIVIVRFVATAGCSTTISSCATLAEKDIPAAYNALRSEDVWEDLGFGIVDSKERERDRDGEKLLAPGGCAGEPSLRI